MKRQSAADRELVYSVATDADESDVRRLLREQSMSGSIQLAFEREPDAYAAGFGLADSHRFLIVRAQGTGAAIAVCERRVHAAYVDGVETRLPYLAALRVIPEYRHRIKILKTGFDAVRRLLADEGDAGYALTSIGADNLVSLRLLSKGLRGLPEYRPLGPLSTLALAATPKVDLTAVEVAGPGDVDAIADLLQSNYRSFQAAPVWTAERLRGLDRRGTLPIDRFLVVRGPRGLRGCIAVWDQRQAKQTRVVDYHPAVRRFRAVHNLAAPWLGRVPLPRPGELLDQAFLSHFAIASEDDMTTATTLVRNALALAGRLGHSVGLLGIAAQRPVAREIQRLWRGHEYRTELFTVHWSDEAGPADRQRPPHPEIALL